MSLSLQSIRSGSSGNCLVVRNGRTTVLFDAGFPSMRQCRNAVGHLLPEVDALVVSHLHGDHVHHYALRVMEEFGVPVYVYEGDVGLLRGKHYRGRPFDGLRTCPFTEQGFVVGGLAVRPFEVPHHPGDTTFGFEVTSARGDGARRLVVATDFRRGDAVQGWFENADLIFVEANHDPELLSLYPNPRSHDHMPNGGCGQLLVDALDHSHTLPSAIVLGHLSEQRNTPDLARDAVSGLLHQAGYSHIPLHVAPRYDPSAPIELRA